MPHVCVFLRAFALVPLFWNVLALGLLSIGSLSLRCQLKWHLLSGLSWVPPQCLLLHQPVLFSSKPLSLSNVISFIYLLCQYSLKCKLWERWVLIYLCHSNILYLVLGTQNVLNGCRINESFSRTQLEQKPVDLGVWSTSGPWYIFTRKVSLSLPGPFSLSLLFSFFRIDWSLFPSLNSLYKATFSFSCLFILPRESFLKMSNSSTLWSIKLFLIISN